jgi:hypothetical protein
VREVLLVMLLGELTRPRSRLGRRTRVREVLLVMLLGELTRPRSRLGRRTRVRGVLLVILLGELTQPGEDIVPVRIISALEAGLRNLVATGIPGYQITCYRPERGA